jgi:hypothetical protein
MFSDMRRLLLIPLALLGLYAGASLAAVNRPRDRGADTIISIGAHSITFAERRHERSCALTAHSPSTAGFAPGELVWIACFRHVLVAIVPVPRPHRHHGTTTTTTTTTTSTTETTTTTTIGTTTTVGTTTTGPTPVTTPTTTTTVTVTSSNAAVTTLTPTSITVGSLTCQIGPGSPSTSPFKVGDVVLIYCTDGTLTSIQLDSF